MICLYVMMKMRRTGAGRRDALVAGAVAAGARRRDRHARRIADPAQGAGGQGDPRSGARERSRNGLLERGRAGATSGRRETARSGAGKARRGLAELPWRLAGRHPRRSATRRAAAFACSRRSGGGCCRWAIRPSLCPHRGSYAPRRSSPATRWRAGRSSRQSPTGLAACARPGRRVKPRPACASATSSSTPRASMSAIATARIARGPQACRRI